MLNISLKTIFSFKHDFFIWQAKKYSNHRRYMAEILPIQRKTLSNQSRIQVRKNVCLRSYQPKSLKQTFGLYICYEIQIFCIPDMNIWTCPLSHPLYHTPLSHTYLEHCGLIRGLSAFKNAYDSNLIKGEK